ncbi:protein DpdJ [Agrobacterium vitis]|uniref:protein DpdJ n=1 Tax=Agrobacterium vitis TaxID=373 RepID=UPI0012E76F59|nr:protein DpdJ [Agrobacterium vitis]MVA26553.1 DEAD/DEAH box helicase [Agrobacterium vitis]
MINPNERFMIAVLDRIEQREARLLTWGLVDGFLASHEVAEIIDAMLDDPAHADGITFVRVSEVVERLRERVLLLDIGETPGERYRSRMAETVRLSYRLRQLFPQHRGLVGWQAAPTLVADFRFLWRRRRYPNRTISAERSLREISDATSDHYARQAIADLIESYGSDFGLAGFQVEAATRILSSLESPRSLATLVSAGTGSGKTLAFYLPALARIASHIRRDGARRKWVKILAVYPRNELLKDQFAEVYSQARRLDTSLQTVGGRKILIGTLFGPTPDSAAEAQDSSGWRRHATGLVCEYLRCPDPNCDGEMIWRENDRANKIERLVCSECDHAIESDEIILTRERLRRESPDILFTTTEMLNQRMGDNRIHHLFGIGERAAHAVEMMLLDEVHTYAGASGAQVAYLLRRWRQMVRGPVSFVGLSATLTDGARFFATLTGLSEHAAAEVAPKAGDMIAEGAEYLLALRGDPVSRTALLSTTIQAAMLLSRMLDSSESRVSRGIFGEKAFLFADNLDVINRLYYAMLDAEGRRSNGAPDLNAHPTGGLATLRFPMTSEHRKVHGQDWEAAVDIGHSLQASDRKRVGRVMSMDPGVGNNLDVIVATASLEVGYNDPLVGAVLQHKAPRDVAQFLQRKGRAGRSRRMRPWTVVVLSDYGRDRIAYQGYDLLFDPELPMRTLPIGNRYVTRIQAVYATLDYLARMTGYDRGGSVWTNLSGPSEYANQRSRQDRFAEVIHGLITSPSELERYSSYLSEALRLDMQEIQSLLWEHPRPLLTEVLPTALRRLETQWRTQKQGVIDYNVRNSPLPEFAPANLFGELNLPEVDIITPAVGGVVPDPVFMPIVQAMREFAPGRVSRRYGITHAFEKHWVCPPLDQNVEQSMPIDANVRSDMIGIWQISTAAGAQSIPVYRPRTYTLNQSPGTVVDTSNARLRWQSQIVARDVGQVFNAPPGNPWAKFIADVRFYTHQGLSPIEVRRMALGSDADIRFKDGTSSKKRFWFERDGLASALGFNLSVDSLCIRLRFDESLWSSVGPESCQLYRALRTARFHDEAKGEAYLASVDNVFARGWLAQLLLSALGNEAMAKSITLREAAGNLANGHADLSLEQTLVILFQSPIVDDANGQGNLQDKLRQDLGALLADPVVKSGLFNLATILWASIGLDWEPWLRQRFAATAGAAAFNAILSLCPEIDGEGLVVDIDPGPREPDDVLSGEQEAEIWISELAPGGNGQIEEALKQYVEDPRRFFNLMTSQLRDSDFALSDYQLAKFVTIVCESDPSGDISTAAQAFRDAYGSDESHRAMLSLRHSLAAGGFATFHAFMVALANRVLRAGSSPQSDRFFLSAMRQWDAEEARLGVELDARVIAYRLARRDDIDNALSFAGIDAPTVNPDQWRFGVVYGLLWPRGSQIRQAGLRIESLFVDLPLTEPLLVRAFINEAVQAVHLREPDWKTRCLEALASQGSITLVCEITDGEDLASALNFLATNPVHTAYLSVFARVQAVRRVGDAYEIDVDIAEALQ